MAPKLRKWPRLGAKRLTGLIVGIVFLASLFIPTPYYLYQPGEAEELQPIITVQNGHKTEKGDLMLLTVYSIPASNIYYLAYGALAPHTEIMKEQDVTQGLSDAEYERTLTHMMDSSQQNAIISGLKAAGEKVTTNFNGVFVSMIMPNSTVKGILQVGDVIKGVDGHTLISAEDLTDYLQKNKKAGDYVTLSYLRDGKPQTSKVRLMQVPVGNQTTPGAPMKPGIGIYPDNDVTLNMPRKVTINAADIGGPSAGLMFSLEIYNQIVPGDLTKGYKIAGTGTIDSQGNVGQIGGIELKIIAAAKKGADIIFCPADIAQGDSNYHDIVAAAKQNNIHVKIVPVKTMQDAINYLKSLPPKQ